MKQRNPIEQYESSARRARFAARLVGAIAAGAIFIGTADLAVHLDSEPNAARDFGLIATGVVAAAGFSRKAFQRADRDESRAQELRAKAALRETNMEQFVGEVPSAVQVQDVRIFRTLIDPTLSEDVFAPVPDGIMPYLPPETGPAANAGA